MVYTIIKVFCSVFTDTPTSEKNNESTCSLKISEDSNQSNQICNILRNLKNDKVYSMKRKKKESVELLDTEEKLKIERIKWIISQEQQLAHIKQTHEEKIANMKKNI